ncbi:hypothetical protein ABKN59_007486 [Abortiporus biennis]
MPNLEFTITHRGVTYPFSLLPDTTLAILHAQLEELTSVPMPNQKLLYKGKKPSINQDDTLTAAGFKSGLKVQMLGSTAEELGQMKSVEDEKKRVDKILADRAMKPQTKLRSTGPSPRAPDPQFKFHKIEPLLHLPNPSEARSVLTRLANDPAIRHVMQKHRFAVGLLTELAPHEAPHLLGLNQNAGQSIKLRLRTDAYDGFRPYSDVRRVLCHELTHNVWGDHDNNFKELNSQLNREVAEYERSVAQGTHSLGSLDVYEPGLEADAYSQILGRGSYVLGGGTSTSTPLAVANESREDRRRRLLQATMNRLQKEEEELEQSCGTAGPSSS